EPHAAPADHNARRLVAAPPNHAVGKRKQGPPEYGVVVGLTVRFRSSARKATRDPQKVVCRTQGLTHGRLVDFAPVAAWARQSTVGRANQIEAGEEVRTSPFPGPSEYQCVFTISFAVRISEHVLLAENRRERGPCLDVSIVRCGRKEASDAGMRGN